MSILTNNPVPTVTLPDLYVNGCQGAWVSDTTRSIAPGQLRDSTNTYDILFDTPLIVSSAFNGVNGLDTGTVAENTRYYVFVIFDYTNTNLPASLLSLSPDSPVMPSLNGITYGAFRLVDTTVTDGSSNFLLDYNHSANENTIYKQYDAPQSVLSAGVDTTYTAVNLSTDGIVPVFGFGKIWLNAAYTPKAAGDIAQIQPTGATGNFIVINGIVASVVQTSQIMILPSLGQISMISPFSANISYNISDATSPAGLDLAVSAYEFDL